jgi:hypothetical protein
MHVGSEKREGKGLESHNCNTDLDVYKYDTVHCPLSEECLICRYFGTCLCCHLQVMDCHFTGTFIIILTILSLGQGVLPSV